MLGDRPAWSAFGLALSSKVAPTQRFDVGGLMLTVGLSLTRTVAVALALALQLLVLVLVAVTVKLNVPLLPLLHDTGLPVLLTKVPPLLAQA